MIRWLHILLPLVILVGALALRVSDPEPVQRLRLFVFDAYQRAAPREYDPEKSPVRIVDIDDESLARLGQWPWPRTVIAGMVDQLRNLGAAVIAFDVVFAEPDRTSPEEVLKVWPKTRATVELAGDIAKIPHHDDIFASAISRARVVTGFILTGGQTENLPTQKVGFGETGDDPRMFLQRFSGAVVNLPALETVAAGNGVLNYEPDLDLVVRRLPMVLRMGDKLYPSLVAESLRVALGQRGYTIKASGASSEWSFGIETGIAYVRIGNFPFDAPNNFAIPTDARGQLVLRFTPHEERRFIPVWRLFEPDFDRGEVDGNIILIGTSAAGLKDIRVTPVGVETPGVEIHAQAIEQILNKDYVFAPDWVPGVELAYLLVLGLLMILISHYLSAVWAALAGGVAATGAGASSWYAYVGPHVLIDPVFPTLMAFLIFLSETLLSYFRSERERRQVRGAFSRYMSPKLVEQLAEHPEQLKLGGETRDMTLLFSDIRGFTTISEQYDAEGLTSLINRYFTPMTEIILEQRGTIDKYMGDAIMAFWNAPLMDADHARHACAAALEMRERLTQLNIEWQAQAEAEDRPFHPIRAGIGLNSGLCCVGNLGSELRFDYSVIGDDVNVASRLEGLSKFYGVDIVIGENTEEAAPGFATLELDLIRVVGKTRPVRVHTLLGPPDETKNEAFQALAVPHGEMIAAVRGQDWDAAVALIAECEKLAVAGGGPVSFDKLYGLYRERIAACQASPPGADWDGVFAAESK